MPSIRRDLGDVMNTEFAERTQLWGPAFRLGSIVMVYAPRGVGKTFFVLKLAHALGSASAFMLWSAPRRTKVIIFDGEMGDQSIASRMHQIEGAAPASMAFNQIFLVNYADCGGTMWNLSDPEHQEWYNREIGDCDVVIVDNLLTCSYARGPRDEEFSQWARIQPFLIRLREAGKMVVLVHHAGKNASQYGTSLKENICDTIVGLKPVTDGGIEVRWEKLRNVPNAECPNLFFEMRSDILGSGITFEWCSMDDKFRQQVLTMNAQNIKPREIAEILGTTRARVAKILTEYTKGDAKDDDAKYARRALETNRKPVEENDDRF